MASRAIYHDGWMASAFGPRTPWLPGLPEGIDEWTPDDDTWELYNLDEDWSQNNDLAAQMPEKVAQMKEIFAIEAAKNEVLPIGGGLWVPVFHPELRITPPYSAWEFDGVITRMPEFCAPALGNKNNIVRMEVDVPDKAEGVLYKLGGAGGGLTCFVDDGYLCYEYNLFIVMKTKIRSDQRLPIGKTMIEVETAYSGGEVKMAGPLDITLRVGGKEFASGNVPFSAPLLFSANDCLDFGMALGSPVSMDYYDRAPFAFNGTIERVHVRYT
jgi:arylsulfatase